MEPPEPASPTGLPYAASSASPRGGVAGPVGVAPERRRLLGALAPRPGHPTARAPRGAGPARRARSPARSRARSASRSSRGPRGSGRWTTRRCRHVEADRVDRRVAPRAASPIGPDPIEATPSRRSALARRSSSLSSAPSQSPLVTPSTTTFPSSSMQRWTAGGPAPSWRRERRLRRRRSAAGARGCGRSRRRRRRRGGAVVSTGSPTSRLPMSQMTNRSHVEELGVRLDERLEVALGLLHPLEDELDGARRLAVEDPQGPEVRRPARPCRRRRRGRRSGRRPCGWGSTGRSSSPAPAGPAARRSGRRASTTGEPSGPLISP